MANTGIVYPIHETHVKVNTDHEFVYILHVFILFIGLIELQSVIVILIYTYS